MNNNKKPLVAVIIPVYNRAGFLKQTIDSVLSQTYRNIQLIVVDDGSTDGSYELIKSYGDKLTLITHPNHKNQGQSASINLGIKYVIEKCDYIAILDSDDYWLPEKVYKQVKVMINKPDVGLVYGNGYGVNVKGERLYEIYTNKHVEESKPENVLLDCYFLLPNNSLVRESIYQKAGFFDESLRAAQDHDMAIRIAECTKLEYIPDHVFCYRRHENSISHRNADIRWQNGFIILKKAKKRYPYSRSVIRKRSAVLHFRLFQIFMEKKRRYKAIGHLIAAGYKDPVRSVKVLFGVNRVTSPH